MDSLLPGMHPGDWGASLEARKVSVPCFQGHVLAIARGVFLAAGNAGQVLLGQLESAGSSGMPVLFSHEANKHLAQGITTFFFAMTTNVGTFGAMRRVWMSICFRFVPPYILTVA